MKKSLKDTYTLYINTNDNPVDFKTYIDITSKFMLFIMEKIFQGFCVPLPGRLGTLEVIGKKQKPRIVDGEVKGLAPNWPETKKLWDRSPKAKEEKKLVYHTNYETNGYRYKFFWSKKRVLVQNKSLYTLRMTRNNKRTLSEHIENEVPYKTVL